MGVKVTVKRRFVVGGKEYGSLEELPADVRKAVETALARRGSEGEHAEPHEVHSSIIVNGHEYGSVDDMPPEVRRLYGGAMAAVDAGRLPGAANPGGQHTTDAFGEVTRDTVPMARPIEPGVPTPLSTFRALVFGLLILIALLGLYLYLSRVP